MKPLTGSTECVCSRTHPAEWDCTEAPDDIEQNRQKDPDTGEDAANRIEILDKCQNRYLVLLILVAIGAGVCSAFISLGIKNVANDQELRFQKKASVLVRAIEATWKDYELVGSWIHEACRSKNNGVVDVQGESFDICSRQDFGELYEYVVAGGLQFQSIAYVPNVTDQYREELEMEALSYYSQFYPDMMYFGFVGLEPDPNSESGFGFRGRSQQPFYFPTHLIEPVVGNEYLVDFDMYSSARSDLVDKAVTSWEPILSNPVRANPAIPGNNYIILLHPGVKVSTQYQASSGGLSSVIATFSMLIEHAAAGERDPVSVYIWDINEEVDFFGGVHIDPQKEEGKFTYMDYADLEVITENHSMVFRQDISIEHQTWAVVVVPQKGTYEANNTFVILGGVLVLVACLCLALWFHSKMSRDKKVAEIKRAAESEKAALIVKNAQNAEKAERELNDYIAHEVRNPLTAAISACSFLSFTHKEHPTLISGEVNDELSQSVSEDISVIHSSLQFINDLLRSMLDMHKAANNQMKLEACHTAILQDVFVPVKALLWRRSNNFDLIVDCPAELVVYIDRMRLKQIVLNLASNSAKFVHKGYVRLRAAVVDEHVEISVEDSGPGISKERRSKLFSRFQESLDSLNQGTGMGLSLCKTLVDLMGGEILLDEHFDSGIEECPGTRFTVRLKIPPIQIESIDFDKIESNLVPHQDKDDGADSNTISSSQDELPLITKESVQELPDNLSVLIVDDDLILRKLLTRSLRRVAPTWSIQEAANGETALTLTDTDTFDLIFLDQYMASVEKQLLGTETAFALRAKGITSRICGLSANNLEDAFLESGANSFLLKPFNSEKEALTKDLLGLVGDLYSGIE
mmetsp:Transcript_5570/g.8534  ORF Transcript_5570/g.8534 Transcript_5570/m.8534 type:complete len:862 (+) Transcript_5570:152-2737(+)